MKSYNLHILVLLFFFTSGILCSQTKLSLLPKPDKAYFKSYITDVKDIAISPIKWDNREWIIAGTTIGLSGLLYINDKKVQRRFQNNRVKFIDETVKYGIENWGDGTYSIPLLGIIYSYGLIKSNERCMKTALLGTKAFIISSGLTYLVKFSAHRHRPYENNPSKPYIWDGPSLKNKNLSFLSGHSTTVFSIATVIAHEYKDQRIIPVISYSIAGLTAVSRIYQDKHWSSDVLLSSVIGYAIGKLICSKNNWGIQLQPITTANFNGALVLIPIGLKD